MDRHENNDDCTSSSIAHAVYELGQMTADVAYNCGMSAGGTGDDLCSDSVCVLNWRPTRPAA